MKSLDLQIGLEGGYPSANPAVGKGREEGFHSKNKKLKSIRAIIFLHGEKRTGPCHRRNDKRGNIREQKKSCLILNGWV